MSIKTLLQKLILPTNLKYMRAHMLSVAQAARELSSLGRPPAQKGQNGKHVENNQPRVYFDVCVLCSPGGCMNIGVDNSSCVNPKGQADWITAIIMAIIRGFPKQAEMETTRTGG